VGAGAVGVEFASIFNSFGTQVTVLEMLPRGTPIEEHGWMIRMASSGEIFRFRELTTLQQWIGGTLDLSANPVVSVLTGPVGTNPGGWPSGIRKVGATPPLHLSVNEQVRPIEQHGFTIADFTSDTIVLRFFKWDVNTQSAETLDTLEPFHTAELQRPA
jgi:hypothetical protein